MKKVTNKTENKSDEKFIIMKAGIEFNKQYMKASIEAKKQ